MTPETFRARTEVFEKPNYMHLMRYVLVSFPESQAEGCIPMLVNQSFDLACKNSVMNTWTSYVASPALLTLVDLRRRLLYSLDPGNPGKLIVQLH